MTIADNLYWHKYRPKTLNHVILAERIRKAIFDADGNPKKDNFLLYGPAGMGKSTVAGLICEGRDVLKMNASYDSSVDDLRETVNMFCRTYGLMASDDDSKVVWLDEFDGVSKQYQEALRAFMEDNIERVNFIATANDITKIIPGIQSRFKMIDFTPASPEEADALLKGYVQRLGAAMKHAGHVMPDDKVLQIVQSGFPDFRRIFNDAQMSTHGDERKSVTGDSLFELIVSKKGPQEVMDYVTTNWTNRIPALVFELGRPFAGWIFKNRPNETAKTVETMQWADECGRTLQQSIDPTLTGVALICKMITKFS